MSRHANRTVELRVYRIKYCVPRLWLSAFLLIVLGPSAAVAQSSLIDEMRAYVAQQPRTFDNTILFRRVDGQVLRSDRFTAIGVLFGDFDGDGDVDLFDFNAAQICHSFSGPGTPIPPACHVFDSDGDFDVDLEDMSVFLEVYTGRLAGVVVEAGELVPIESSTGFYYSGEPGTSGSNALNGTAGQAGFTQDDLWYEWSVAAQPVDSGEIVVSNASLPATAFTILSPVPVGAYVFTLTVTNLVTLDVGLDTTALVVFGCLVDADCDDLIFCTDDTCDLTINDCVFTPNNANCANGAFCDGDETCVPGDASADANGCLGGTDPCVAGETCDESTDLCSACTANADCNDNDNCTTDTCVSGGCVFTPVGCPSGQSCNPANGNCVDIVCTTDADCDDGASCTTDVCNVGNGTCVNTPIDAACDDGLFCTANDVCDTASDDADAAGCVNDGDPCECTGGATDCDTAGGAVGDNLLCNEGTDACDDCASNADCDDGITCSTDTCNGATGVCTHVDDDTACPDANFCNGPDTCLPDDPDADANGCVSPGNPCSGTTPVCDDTTDACNACTSNLECSDGFACTDDSCNGTTGACTNTNNNVNCPDTLFCDGVDTCTPTDPNADGNGCVGPGTPCSGITPVCNETTDTCSGCTANTDCDDSVACTDDQCNGTTGACTITANNANCPGAGDPTGANVCNATAGCVQCNASADCTDPTLNVCDTTTNTCVDCLVNADCVAPTPNCIANTCSP